MAKSWSALKAAKSRLDDRLASGRMSTDKKIDDYYRRNASELNDGLVQTRSRLAKIRGTGVSSSTPLSQIFKMGVESRMDNGSSLREAVNGMLKSDIFRGAQGMDNYMRTWQREMGKPGIGNPATAGWRKFKKDTGWKGEQSDWDSLQWDNAAGAAVYTDRNGVKWMLSFTDSPKTPIYSKI